MYFAPGVPNIKAASPRHPTGSDTARAGQPPKVRAWPMSVEDGIRCATGFEEVYTKWGSGTKKSIQRIQISSLKLGPMDEYLFHDFQEEIKNVVKLAHRDARSLYAYMAMHPRHTGPELWHNLIPVSSTETSKTRSLSR